MARQRGPPERWVERSGTPADRAARLAEEESTRAASASLLAEIRDANEQRARHVEHAKRELETVRSAKRQLAADAQLALRTSVGSKAEASRDWLS